MSMEMSFFTSCPLTGGISVPLQTMCTSNSSLSSRNFVRVRRFEAAYWLVFVRAWLKKDISMLIHQVFKRAKMLPFNKENPNG
jgi:hypothetical protein